MDELKMSPSVSLLFAMDTYFKRSFALATQQTRPLAFALWTIVLLLFLLLLRQDAGGALTLEVVLIRQDALALAGCHPLAMGT